MSFKPYTEKIKKKKFGICSILGRIRIRIQNRTGSGSIIPEADPRIRIRNTASKYMYKIILYNSNATSTLGNKKSFEIFSRCLPSFKS